ADISDANSTEFDPATGHPVISTMAEQLDIVAGEGRPCPPPPPHRPWPTPRRPTARCAASCTGCPA
ncbi:hypothetical protein E0E62_30500, partial [Streptomyces sp. 16-176A]